jgi:MFS superfamily sulfate permease-like transporter
MYYRYTGEDLRQDVMAGLVVGVIALSLSMALGIASESTPAIG